MSPHIYIFGDQTWAVEASLTKLLDTQADEPGLQRFFREAFVAIKHEIASLPRLEKQSFPTADSLGLLVEAFRGGRRHVALDAAFACLNQVGLYLQSKARVQRESTPDANLCVLGICTGSFASAVVACGRLEHEVVNLGVEAVKVAFRVGLIVARVGDSLAHPSNGSWSALVSNTTEARALKCIEQFQEQDGSLSASQLYVSGIGPNAVTISGPPQTLSKFLADNTFGPECKSTPVPIHGPYHGILPYSNDDIEKLVVEVLLNVGHLQQQVDLPSICCTNGGLSKATTFEELLSESIENILSRQVRMDRTVNFLATLGVEKLTGFHTHATASLASILSRDAKTVEIEQSNSNSGRAQQRASRSNKIAIIGFSGRFPDADGLDEFWDALCQGLDTHRPTPADRFDGDLHFDATLQKKNTSRVKHGCWIRRPGLFDSRFFHISPREAAQSDPAQRLALLTAYEALEMAGFVPDRTDSTKRHRVGVFYGTTSDDWREVNSGQNVDTYFIPGGNRAFVPGRVNYFFKFSGPSISVDTACSSSLAGINIAINSLINGDCDSAVAGGTNIMTNPDNFAGLDRGHFLAPAGNCKTFDDAADGYCRADGVGTVILKRYEDAIADKDPIFGVVLGARTNHSAEAVSITRPLADAQEYLFKRLLNDSRVNPHDIGYIEMHGTGTQAGDAVEMTSVLNSFAWDHSRKQDQTLYLGSAKANFGHAESASGVIALIKVLMMMQKNMVPVHVGIKKQINSKFPKDLAQRNVHIARQNTPWPRPANGQKRKAFVNNFSAAGGNTTLLVEDGDVAQDIPGQDPRTTHVVAVSAQSSKSLRNNLISLAGYIEQNGSPNLLAQLSYTTTARKVHHNRRVAFAVNDLQQLVKSVLQSAESADTLLPIPAKTPGVGLMFTGQGAADTAMGQQLYMNLPCFRADMDSFDRTIRSLGYPSILPLVTGSTPIDELSATTIHLGTCAFQIGLAQFLKRMDLRPRYVLGHSLGEYATLQIAGVLTISDAFWLCGYRAQMIEKRCKMGSHGMLAVNASCSSIQEVAKSYGVEIACINGPQDTVLSGPTDNIAEVAKKLQTEATMCKVLQMPYAFHSAQMDEIVDDLEQAARRVEFRKPTVPVVSTLLGRVVTEEGVFGPEYIRRHCREPVNFLGAVESAVAENSYFQKSDINIEIGAHPLLMRMVKTTLGPEVRTLPTMRRGEDSFKTLGETLKTLYVSGVEVSWDHYHRAYPACQKVLSLPSYQWDYADHWITYENAFCLTKGDAVVSAEPQKEQQAPAKPEPRLSDSVHRLIERQDDEKRRTKLVAQSDLHDPHLLPIAQQHRVNGLTLVPSSLYADITYTLAKYLVEECSPNPSRDAALLPDVCNMVVDKTLIVNDHEEPQLFRMEVDFDWLSHSGTVEFYSADAAGARGVTHAKCDMRLQDPALRSAEWRNRLPLIKRSIAHLSKGAEMGAVHKLGRGMAYKLFSSAVQYGELYQGMREVYFDSQNLEGSARVQFAPNDGARFGLNPCWIDSLGHLTGFIMNSNDTLDLDTNVYVNHGWRQMYIKEPLTTGATYETFVSMQPLNDDDSSFSGDVYILRDSRVVGVFGEVTFNKIPKKVLEMLLPRPRGAAQALAGKNQSQSAIAARPAKATAPAPAVQKSEPTRSRAQQPTATAKASPPVAVSGVTDNVLAVVAEEAGLAKGQLQDDMEFADLGVDSLMSLSILATMRESLGLDVPPSLFVDCTSVKSLREYLVESHGGSSDEMSDDESDASSSSDGSHLFSSDDQGTGTSTPGTVGTLSPGGVDSDKTDAAIDFVLSVLAEELGVKAQDLPATEDLGEMGMDSLLSLTVLGKVCDGLDMDLAPDFFVQHPRVVDIRGGLRELLGGGRPEPTPAPAAAVEKPKQQPAPATAPVKALTTPPATSILLQDAKRESSTKQLFLFPDGSGSATSYISLPKISSSVRVYALNCPYIRDPEKMKCGLQDMTAAYIGEIRRRQPHGPYTLAGWSAGGIAAYHAAQCLLEAGESVERLILLDSPNPIGLSKLPERFYQTLEQAGVFGDGTTKPPKWLIQHFLAFIEALDAYKPVPMAQFGKSFKTTIIWATDGITGGGQELQLQRDASTETREMQWLMDKRTDLQFNGWDGLLDKKTVDVVTIPGANHFNLVRMPHAQNLATAISKSMLS